MFVIAQAQNEEAGTEGKAICNYILNGKKVSIGKVLPKIFPYKNERFNAYTKSGETVGHVVIEDRTITSVGCTLIENPTYNAYVKDLNTITPLFNKNKQLDALDDALSSKELTIEGVKTTKKIKQGFSRVLVKIASWFD